MCLTPWMFLLCCWFCFAAFAVAIIHSQSVPAVAVFQFLSLLLAVAKPRGDAPLPAKPTPQPAPQPAQSIIASSITSLCNGDFLLVPVLLLHCRLLSERKKFAYWELWFCVVCLLFLITSPPSTGCHHGLFNFQRPSLRLARHSYGCSVCLWRVW